MGLKRGRKVRNVPHGTDEAIIHVYRNMTCRRVYACSDTLYTAPHGPFSQIRSHIVIQARLIQLTIVPTVFQSIFIHSIGVFPRMFNAKGTPWRARQVYMLTFNLTHAHAVHTP